MHSKVVAGCVFAVLAVSFLGCSNPDEGQSTPEIDYNICTGKCDGPGGSLRELEPIDVQAPAQCELLLDETTDDPFFQRDRVVCRFNQIPENNFGSVSRIYTHIRDGEGRFLSDSSHEADELDGEPIEIGGLSGDAYPVEVSITVFYETRQETGVQLGETPPARDNAFHGHVETLQSRPDDNVTIEAPALFDLWPVVYWPSVELAEKWAEADAPAFLLSTDYAFDVASDALAVGGPEPVDFVDYDWQVYAAGTAQQHVDLLTSNAFYLPVPPDAPAPQIRPEVDITGGNDATATTITGPGYYVIGPDAGLTRTEIGSLPGVDNDESDPDAGPPGDVTAEDAASDDISVDGADGRDTGIEDPCEGECSESQVCVDGGCVERDEQIQTECWEQPERACDLGEDRDCASGHVCVNQLCRELRCQVQSECWNAPDRPCADDADCADGHICVDEMCRELRCQVQSECWEDPDKPCADDGDCADGHVCVDEMCRELRCQAQSECWEDPDKPCADDSDCADGHSCNGEGLCTEDRCQ
jgi:hypothetical protein